MRRVFTIADLKADGKRPECGESLMIDVRCGRRSPYQDGGSEKMLADDLVRKFCCGLIQYFLHFISRDRLKCIPDRATERLIGDRGRGDSS